MKNTFKNINEYILLFPDEVQQKLIDLREIIHSEIIGLEEYIGYQMPAFRYKGKPLVYFAGYNFIPVLKASVLLKKSLNKNNISFQKERFSFRQTRTFQWNLLEK